MSLEFIEEGHVYLLDGVEIPSVTQIIAPLYDFAGISAARMEYASARGKAVHRATELYDMDDLDEAALDPVIFSYLEAWKRFKSENKVEITGMEQMLHNEKHSYAGKFDRTAVFDGGKWLLDIKATAALTPAIGVQLAGYGGLLDGTERRGAVQLKPDGTYRLQEYTSRSDWPTFLSLLTIYNWRKNNGK